MVYTRAGLPVEITAEFENWRRIRDWEGAEGWVYHSLLSGRRTAVVDAQGQERAGAALRPGRRRRRGHRATAARRAGTVKRCTGNWCRIAGAGFDGWVVQEQLWGVYPNEKVE